MYVGARLTLADLWQVRADDTSPASAEVWAARLKQRQAAQQVAKVRPPPGKTITHLSQATNDAFGFERFYPAYSLGKKKMGVKMGGVAPFP